MWASHFIVWNLFTDMQLGQTWVSHAVRSLSIVILENLLFGRLLYHSVLACFSVAVAEHHDQKELGEEAYIS